MAELATIARPYAEAVFALARDENALPVWSEMLGFAAGVAGDPKMAAALDNPKLTAAQKESLFLSVCGERLHGSGRNFARFLIESDRIRLLPHIIEQFEALRRDAEGVAKARIQTALPLSDAQLAELAAALERRFGRRVETSVAADESLIGGVRISVGDEVIDGSVAGRLAAMSRDLST